MAAGSGEVFVTPGRPHTARSPVGAVTGCGEHRDNSSCYGYGSRPHRRD